MTQRINISLPKDMAKFLAEDCKRNSKFVGVLGTNPEPYECYDEFVDQYEQQKDSQTQEIFSLGLNPAEFVQLRDLLDHVKHIEMEARPEEKLRFIRDGRRGRRKFIDKKIGLLRVLCESSSSGSL